MIDQPRSEVPLNFVNVRKWKIHKERSPKTLKKHWDHCPEILEDESFSSYFTRTAKANFAKHIPIVENIDNRRINVKKFDLDRHIKLETINTIAYYLNKEPTYLREICLIPNPQRLSTIFFTNGARYCPFCLEGDGEQPYFRYYWRLTFITVCIKHGCFLQDHCPNCHTPVRYWETNFNQPMSSCFKCGTSLINAKTLSKSTGDEFKEEPKFQDYFIKIYKTGQWHGKPITKEHLMKLLWRLVGAMREDPIYKYQSKNYENWKKYAKRLCCSLEETARAFYAAFQTVQLDPERLERRFVCPVEGQKFSTIQSYLNHRITHIAVKCPLTNCQAEEICVLKEGYLCRTCGTAFKTDGIITKKGVKLSCPLQNCKSHNVRFGKQGYSCRSCGTVFTANESIIKIGVKLSCPQPNCTSKSIRAENKMFKCKICGTEFKLDGTITKERRKQSCPLKGCRSKNIRALKEGEYRCRMCGTVFRVDGNVIKMGKKLVCPLEECRSKSVRTLKEVYQCKSCGTEFKLDGSIVKKGIKRTCPLKGCNNKEMRVLKKGYKCRVCGTEFKLDGTITKKGKNMKCPRPCCNTVWIHALKQGYRCKTCHTRFNADGTITEKGKPRPRYKCKSEYMITPIRGCEMCSITC